MFMKMKTIRKGLMEEDGEWAGVGEGVAVVSEWAVRAASGEVVKKQIIFEKTSFTIVKQLKID